MKATLRILGYSVTPATFRSVLREFNAWPGLDVDMVDGMANIDRGRSMIASAFMERPSEEAGDVLLMVDSDNAWRTGDLFYIAKMALAHRAVVGGVYAKRRFNSGLAVRFKHEGEHDMGTERLVSCDYVGTGFIAIPREVLAAVGETLPLVQGGFKPYFMPFVREYKGQTEYPTDDAAFCARVWDAGYTVFASMFPKLTHEGNYSYRVQDGYTKVPGDVDMTISFVEEGVLVG